ncbi:hypothetical protein [Sphingobacterium hotanense]|uniref:hypothetical protein n=1 Tax=Sphingobacterium hotanense TaxID=649196 RepID=UPI0021A55043|nr:hypothetical protein [Sphingobacterium hotanense]MCT1524340.1 hypothetical protein [Sphingobacterium hotanense]
MKEKKAAVSEPGKKGFKDWQDHVERKNGLFLNQEKKDLRIGRITLKEKKAAVSEPGKEGCKDWQDQTICE